MKQNARQAAIQQINNETVYYTHEHTHEHKHTRTHTQHIQARKGLHCIYAAIQSKPYRVSRRQYGIMELGNVYSVYTMKP